MLGLAEESAQLLLADGKTGQLHHLDDIHIIELQGDSQLPEDDVVVQNGLGLEGGALFFAPVFDDQAAQKDGHLGIVQLFEFRLVILLQPIANLLARDYAAAQAENGDHGRVVEIKGKADAA